MRRTVLFLSLAAALLVGYSLMQDGNATAQTKEGHLISHDVFFTLKDNSAESKKKLVGAARNT